MDIINNLLIFLSDTITYIFFVGVFYFFYRSLYNHYIFEANGKNNISKTENYIAEHYDLELEEVKDQPLQVDIQPSNSEKQIADSLSSEQTNNISQVENSIVEHDDLELEEVKEQPLQADIQPSDSEKQIADFLCSEQTNNISQAANSIAEYNDLELEEVKEQPLQEAIQQSGSDKQIADSLSSEQTNNINKPANSTVLHHDLELEEVKEQTLQAAIQQSDSDKQIADSLSSENIDAPSGATTNNTLVIANNNEPLSSVAQDIKVEQSIVSNPFNKRVLVGVTTLIGVLAVGMCISQFLNGNSKDKQLQQQSIQTAKNFNKPEETQQLEQNQFKTETTPQPTVTPTTSPKTITPVVVEKVPISAPIVYVPKIVTVEQVVEPQPIVRASAIITPRPASTKPKFLKPVPPKPVPVSPEAIEKNATPKKEVDLNRQDTATQTLELNEKSVAVGTRVKAILTTALFGEIKFAANDNKNDSIFVIRLKEPLKNIDGTIALPIGTKLIAKIYNISDSGMLQLNVTSIIRQDNNKLTKTILPESAITIVAPKGKPLISIRNQQAISVRKASGNTWFLQRGAEVEVYINQPIQLVNLDSHPILDRL